MLTLRRLLNATLPAKVMLQIDLVRDRLWDFWHQVQTAGDVELLSLTVVGLNRPHGVLYQATSPGLAKKHLMQLDVDYQQYTFIDLGSGKGRVLLIASGFPFKAVIGVEFADELHRIATENIHTYRRSTVRCRSIECVKEDAANFQYPPTPLVLYFHNPFGDPVMSSVVDNIQRSLDERPRDVRIICSGPMTRTDIVERLHGIQVVSRQSDEAFVVTYRIDHPQSLIKGFSS